MAIHIREFAGLAPKLTDRLSKPNIASIAQNVDLDRGTLKPFKEPGKVSDAVGESLHSDDCCHITGNCNTNFAEHGFGCNEIIVATGLYDFPVYSKKGECPPIWRKLGYDCELPAPTINTVDEVDQDFSMEMRSYYYTLVNDMGWESQPSYPSEWKRTNAGKPVIVTGITPSTNDYETINIYRTSNPLDYGVKQPEVVSSDFLLVGSIPKGETSFTDETLVPGKMNVTEEYTSPPSDLYSVDSWRGGRIVGLSGNTIVMSERGLPYAFNKKYTVAFDQSQAKRLIATDRKAYVLTDGRPFVITLNGDCDDKQKALDINDTLEPMPIVSQRSAVEYLGGVVYASNTGLVLLNELNPQVLTQDYFSHDQWRDIHPHTMVGVIHEGYYYGVTDTVTIRFRLPDNIYASKAQARLTTLSLKPIAMDVSNQGRLYMTFDDDERQGTYEWEQGKELLEMEWQSTIQVEPGITRYSAYKVVAEGAGNTITHYVDTMPIQEYQHKQNKPTRLPVGYNGLNWQVNIRGYEEVFEYHLAPSIAELSLE